MDCVRTYVRARHAKRPAFEIDGTHPGCVCENCRCDGGTAGPVADDEWLARIVPANDATSEPPHELLGNKFDQMHGGGVSLCRARAPVDEIRVQVTRLLRPDRPLRGYLPIQARELREWSFPLAHERGLARDLCVYATPSPNCLNHADLMGTFPVDAKTESARRKFGERRRKKFVETFGDRFVEEADLERLIGMIQSLT